MAWCLGRGRNAPFIHSNEEVRVGIYVRTFLHMI